MKRKSLLVTAVIGISLTLSGYAQNRSVAEAYRGTIVFLEGKVRIDGAAAEIGQELGAKASITTGKGAACDIVFNDKNALRVGQNSSVVLDFSSIAKSVRVKKGGLTSVLRKLDKVANADAFRVSTPTAVAAVRGTSFCVWVDEGSTYVCACNGSVRTIDAGGSNELDLSAEHHSARIYAKKYGTIGVRDAGVEHHSDASVESLAARIGEKIDWTKRD